MTAVLGAAINADSSVMDMRFLVLTRVSLIVNVPSEGEFSEATNEQVSESNNV